MKTISAIIAAFILILNCSNGVAFAEESVQIAKEEKESKKDMKPEVIKTFCELVNTGKIEDRLRNQPSMNIEMPVINGGVFWDEIAECKGWKLQRRHGVLGGSRNHYRIIGPDNVRYAFGTAEYVSRRIMGQPINVLTNYLYQGDGSEKHFFKYACIAPVRKGSVVLIHGWGCRAVMMKVLAERLNAAGYDAYCYDYPSSQRTIQELGTEFLADLTFLKTRLPEQEDLFIISHSMGGLVVRKTLELDVNDAVSSRISQIVMLAPPNKGSLMADLAEMVGLGLINDSIGDIQYLGESAVKQIGKPAHYSKAFGIISGKRDGKVLPGNSVEIPGMTKDKDYFVIQVDASHPGLRTSVDAFDNALHYMEHGKF